MSTESYHRLAEHLNRLPGGFPPSSTGAEIRLLRTLFTPEEANLATHLTLERETAASVADRAGLPLAVAEQRLSGMADKGLIFAVQPDDAPSRYQAVPFVVGIYEFQVNNLSAELLTALDDYWRTQEQEPRPPTIPQMRTIPVHESIELRLEALPYEHVYELVKAHDRYAVAPCICRKSAKIAGDGCDAPEETCLMFDEWADFYVNGGRGRVIDRAEVMEILAKADDANLVLQPTNSKDAAAICCCCGCCCGILGGLKRHPRPSEAVASAFIAQLDPDMCVACWTCLDRFQMQALARGDTHVIYDADRCIGCGLCVSTCPSGALTLTRKPETDHTVPPDTITDTWRIIADAQAGMRETT